jgi:hypothetical protein
VYQAAEEEEEEEEEVLAFQIGMAIHGRLI